jgi:hypothetical protein
VGWLALLGCLEIFPLGSLVISSNSLMIIYSGIVFLACHLVIPFWRFCCLYFGCRCQEEEKKRRKKERRHVVFFLGFVNLQYFYSPVVILFYSFQFVIILLFLNYVKTM